MRTIALSTLTLAILTGCATVAEDEAPAASNQAALVAGDPQRIVDIIVSPTVYTPLLTDLNRLKADMQAEGWLPRISQFSGNAQQLRTQLATEFQQSGGQLAGVFFVGDLPTVKIDSSWWPNDGWGPGNFDYYYMDLDGEWIDTDGDGGFDFHGPGSGDRTPEIFAGRISGTNVSLYGKSEIDLLRGYLQRDHAFRAGTSPGTGQSVFINQTGFEQYPGVPEILQAQTNLFSNTTVVAYDHDYGTALPHGLASRYFVSTPTQVSRAPLTSMFNSDIAAGFDFMHFTTHGTPTDLTGLGNSGDFARVSMAGGQLPRFINTHSCLTARLSDPNSVGQTAVLGGTLGYYGFGILSDYPPEWDVALLQALKVAGATTGEALKAVDQYAFALDPFGTSVAWLPASFYLLGDPTLRAIYKIAPPKAPQFVNTQKLEVWLADAGSNSQSTAIKLFIKNVGTAPVSLAGKRVQYVFNLGELPEGTPALDEYVSPSSTVRLVSIPDGLRPLRWAIEFDFSAFQGTLAPGASTSWGTGCGENVRIHFSDWAQNWQEGDDYSANGKTSAWAVSKYLNIFDGSTLIYGYK